MTKIGLTRAEFRKFKPTRKVSGRFFTLLIGSGALGQVTCACVVSKRAVARAVARNAVKRRCREALRANLTSYKEPLTLVFHAKAPAAGASYADIARDVQNLLRRAIT